MTTEIAVGPSFADSWYRWRREYALYLPALGIALLSIYLLSGTERDYLVGWRLWQKQAAWTCLGFGTAFVLSWFSIPLLAKLSPIAYGLNLAVLLSLEWLGTEKGGATSWLNVGPVHVQPSESMKLFTALMLAKALNPPQGATPGFRDFIKAILIAAVPSALIAKQPDLGTAMVFPGILLAASYGSRVPRRYLSLVAVPLWAALALPGDALTWIIWGAGVGLWLMAVRWWGESLKRIPLYLAAHILAVVVLAYGIVPLWETALKPHQRDRIIGFIERTDQDSRDLSPAAYHLRQSLIAIASGGLAGQGLGQGLQSSHDFIPMKRTDFIFAVLAEEKGFIGSLLLMGLLAALFLAALNTATFAGSWKESTFVYAIIGMWATHTFVNLGMTMGLMPITGIPLPFFSYGGSALLTNFVALGLVGSACRRCRVQENPFD